MTSSRTACTDPTPAAAASFPVRPVDWRRALRALRALLAEPDRTEKAFEIFTALDGGAEERGFQRLLADPMGMQLAAAQPCLLSRLSDRAALAALPAGSFGRAYLAYLDRTGFAPDGLVALKADMEAQADSIGEHLRAPDPAREWFRVRGLLMHDLWHVLTGYETDDVGETVLLAFSCAQFTGRANRLLVVGAGLRGAREYGARRLARALYEAWRRGRHAVWLPALPYEDLLAQPLETVRAGAKIAAIPVAHPAGLPAGSDTTAITWPLQAAARGRR
jgi:ubiquinone biosynthesis protein COQ4